MTRPADPQRRDAILRAARAVFDECGYAEAGMADIAQRAGIAAGTLYLYFASKQDLALALCDDFSARLAAALAPAFARPDLRDAIAESVRLSLQFSAEERDLLRLLTLNIGLDHQAHRQRLPARQALNAAIARALEERMARGEMRRYDADLLAETLDGLLESVAEACLIWGDGNIKRYEKVLTPLLQHALMIKPPAAASSRPVRSKRRK